MARRGTDALIAVALTVASAAGAGADVIRAMNAEKIREAIAWGESAPEADLEQYDLHQDRSYVVNCDTPFLRVAQLARALKNQNSALAAADVSPKMTSETFTLYVHARFDPAARIEDFPEVEYVTISRPGPSDAPAQVVMPTAFQSFLRRVPTAADYDGPARLAHSAKAVFPLSALGTASQLKIRFHGGATQVVKLDPALLARVR
ncbi:MAG TPA: hypothetical protein VMV21_03955 [Vicinamibacteria bacterium]|nr:hypothetical protein [Vicinamibacteria bacterium]